MMNFRSKTFFCGRRSTAKLMIWSKRSRNGGSSG